MNEVITVQVPVMVDAASLWSETFGSGWEYSSVAVRVKYHEGTDWETPGSATVTIGGGDDERHSATITVQDLANAYGKLIAMGYHHCGAPIALDDFDACASFDMLQMAVCGELIYG
jgi:hypothetical protein